MSSNSPARRQVGTFALMLTGLGSIIGSGWLFGAWRAAGLAGPGAVWAWVLGAAIIIIIALTYAELGAMFPESGGMVRYGHYSHGSLVGFIAAWANWIAIVSVIPVEAEASVQYMASWPYRGRTTSTVHLPDGHGELAAAGLWIAAVLVVVYFLVNFWSVKVFAHSNTTITLFKLVVPARDRRRAHRQRLPCPTTSASACTARRTRSTSPRCSTRWRPPASCSASTASRAR